MSAVGQDLTAQRDGLAALGAEAERVYVDHGLTGTTRVRPGLREAFRRSGPSNEQSAAMLTAFVEEYDVADVRRLM